MLHGSTTIPNVHLVLRWRGDFDDAELNELHSRAFQAKDLVVAQWKIRMLKHSLGWVTARNRDDLVGFTNVIWDGGPHAWLQDVMVDPGSQHNGIGARIVAEARERAQRASCEWLHVDFEPSLRRFYIATCGFAPSDAGLMDLRT